MSFSFVDEILFLEPGERGKIATFTVIPTSGPYLDGPFRPAGVPPSLVLECLAQSAGCLIRATYRGRGVLPIRVEEVQFQEPLRASERLTAQSELLGVHGDPESTATIWAFGEASVDGRPVATARLFFLVFQADSRGMAWERMIR
ncbi:MAG: 3-hydroxyacyl-ACP dehydratase FabZ family protein [Candidatus Methylomirabilia bacterium]